MARTAVTIGFSVPPETARLVERLARDGGLSKSELFRDMVREYAAERELRVFEELSAYGRDRARERGITSEADIDRLIDEVRGSALGG